MNNEYRIDGEVTVIYVYRKRIRYECLIDTADLPIVQSFPNKWRAVDTGWGMRVVGEITTQKNWKKTTVRMMMHRLLMGNPKGKEIDHINHNQLDNRRSCNLREATSAENKQNKSGCQVNSKSGIRGVSWHKRDQKWRATIQLNGKYIHLGHFEDIGEAERKVIEARKNLMPFSQEALVN